MYVYVRDVEWYVGLYYVYCSAGSRRSRGFILRSVVQEVEGYVGLYYVCLCTGSGMVRGFILRIVVQ